MTDSDRQKKIAAHRGLSGRYPENTLLAFEAAKQAGIIWIETDVSMLKDETLILFHDEAQGRTVAGTKAVTQAVWEDFADADAGLWKGQSFAGQRILRLSDFLSWVHDHELCVHLEIKCHGGRQERTAERLATVLDHASTDMIVISSFDLAFLSHLRTVDPQLRLASIHDEWPQNLSYLKDVLAVEAVHLDHHLVSCVSDVAAVHEQGLFLRTWTVNDRRRAEQLLDWGVDMVMSDYPDQLLISGLSPSFG